MADLETSNVTPTGIWNFTGAAAGSVFNTAATTITANASHLQADATALTAGINNVTVVATDLDAVKLPTAVAGLVVVIVNSDATQTIGVWPNTGDDVGAGANTVSAVALAAGKARVCYAVDATNWKCFTDVTILA